jgi:hypothetical protein
LRQGSGEAVPWDLAQGLRQRVALLPAAAQGVLAAAAVVGRRASRALLLEVLGQSEEAVLAGLEAACRAHLLHEDGEDAYAFAHDVIREVVETELPSGRRSLLHRRIAEALERGADAAPVVLLDHGRALATTYGLGHALVQGSLLAAQLHLRQGSVPAAWAASEEALRLSRQTGWRREEALARHLLGQCALAQGAPAIAVAHLRGALALQTEIGAALDLAHTRLTLAAALVAAAPRGRRPEEAGRLLAEARSGFAASGARRDLAAAEQLVAARADAAADREPVGRTGQTGVKG